MKFKVGEKIKIKDRDYCLHHFNFFNYDEMSVYCEKVTKIKYIEDQRYYLDISQGFFWTADCLQKIAKTMEVE